jgi:arylsulfatase A-like enzyme
MGNVALRFVLEEAIDWLGENISAWPEPFLGYFHFLPPHSPYHTRIEFIDRFKDDGYQPVRKPVHPISFNYTNEEMDDARKAYDEFLLYVDAEFARLFEHLEQQGILDNTWIFLTSDHGEMFERGEVEHTTQLLHQPVIRVPLMVFPPGQNGREDVHRPTSAVDLLPTILTLAGKQIPEWCEGLPLLGDGEGIGEPRPIYAFEAKLNPVREPLNVFTLTRIQEGYKAMIAEGYDGLEAPLQFAYHLTEDPEELDNLLDTDPGMARDLLDDLRAELPEISRRFLESKN